MITLHRLNGDEYVLNSNHIETIEARPDTTITMTNDRKYLAKESVEEIMDRIREYHRSVFIKTG